MCDFVNVSRSIVTRVLQYLAYLLTGLAPRLALLCDDPESFELLWQATEVASCWIHERHLCGMSWPWRLALLIDSRVSRAEKLGILEEFKRVPDEALDYSSLLLRMLVQPDVFVLLSPQWQSFLYDWFDLVLMSVAPIEFEHGHPRGMGELVWARKGGVMY